MGVTLEQNFPGLQRGQKFPVDLGTVGGKDWSFSYHY